MVPMPPRGNAIELEVLIPATVRAHIPEQRQHLLPLTSRPLFLSSPHSEQFWFAVPLRRSHEIPRPIHNLRRHVRWHIKQALRPIPRPDKPEDLILRHRVTADLPLHPLDRRYRQPPI